MNIKNLMLATCMALAMSLTPAIAQEACDAEKNPSFATVEKVATENGFSVQGLTQEEIRYVERAYTKITGDETIEKAASGGLYMQPDTMTIVYNGFNEGSCAVWTLGPLGLMGYMQIESTIEELKAEDEAKAKQKEHESL